MTRFSRRGRKCGGGLAAPAPVRFWAKVDFTPGCWEWLGCINSRGYGCFCFGGKGKIVLAHRWVYEHEVGPIPPGLTIDHLCRNKACVNPAHLEPVTVTENNRRSMPYRKPQVRSTPMAANEVPLLAVVRGRG